MRYLMFRNVFLAQAEMKYFFASNTKQKGY